MYSFLVLAQVKCLSKELECSAMGAAKSCRTCCSDDQKHLLADGDAVVLNLPVENNHEELIGDFPSHEEKLCVR